MKKLIWLTSIVCLCSFMAAAQQEIDSSTKENVLVDGNDTVFANFSYLIKDDNKIILKWQSSLAGADDYFIIERSQDDVNYETIGAIKKTTGTNQYEVADNSSLTGYNFYRIKFESNSGIFSYSKSLKINTTGKVAIKVYPNPVDKLLIVETDHPVNLQVINSLGVPRLNIQLHQGVQVIDVSTLEKGNYILRIVDNSHNRNILQQLVKN